MLKNYFNVALRSLLKNRLYSILNIFGLSIGIAAFIFIIQYVSFERSYENFIANSENLYRVRLDVFRNGELVYKSSENYAGVGPALLNDYPEVLRSAKLYNMGSKNNVVITRRGSDGKNPIVFKHRKFLYAEKDILSMFSYPMIYGDRKTALEKPFTIVISESMSKKYFGDENPMGKFLRLEDDDANDELCEVTGVFKDSPENTHLKFDVLISFSTLYGRGDWAEARYKNGWGRKDFYTYIEVADGTNPALLQSRFHETVSKYKPQNVEQNIKEELLLQPLSDIHLYSQLTDEAEVNGNGEAVSYLSIISFFILIIAWVNYINLSTARSLDRAREVGLRKVLGSYRKYLVLQFLIESLVVNIFSVLISLLIIAVGMSYFIELSGIPDGHVLWQQRWFWITIPLLVVIGTLISGLYPAFVMSSYKPISVLHGKLKSSSRGVVLRKILVVFQFGMSLFMIIGTITVYRQMSFMLDQDLGMDIDRTIVIERPSKIDTSRNANYSNQQRFKNKLIKESNIETIGLGGMLPGKKLRFRTVIRRTTQNQQEAIPFSISQMDYDFVDALDMQMVAGRKFDREFQDHLDTVVLITANGAKGLGYENPDDAINQKLVIERFGNMNVKIIGVMEDFHLENLHEAKSPIMFFMDRGTSEYILLKVKSQDLGNTLAKIEEQWHQIFVGNPFHYFFLDEYFNSYYEADRKFRDLFAVFAMLAIIIGCLGLFGLSSFMAVQRTKEIAIRKVLGSSVLGIVNLLSKEFLSLIAIAVGVTWPMVYWFMNRWLEGFAYRIDMEWVTFLLSGIVILVVALITISYHTLRSANANPVQALNYE